jgi:hypothetical protein
VCHRKGSPRKPAFCAGTGLSTRLVALNWTSQRIPTFASFGSKALDKFQSFLKDARRHMNDINEVVEGIANADLVGCKSNSASNLPMNIEDLGDLVARSRASILDHLVCQYRSIKPLLLKVEMLVADADSGCSPVLTESYSYWEEQVESALELMLF